MPSAARKPVPATKHLNSLFPHCNTLRHVQQLHSQLLLHGLHLSTFFGSRLAQSYFDSGSPSFARQVFDQIPAKNPRSWNTMLAGCSNSQSLPDLLHLYSLSRADNHRPDSFSLVFAIRAFTKLSLLRAGTSIHAEAIRSSLEFNDYVAPSLLNMYLELGSLEVAEKFFDRVHVGKNSDVWGLMMKGYSRASMDAQVVDLFYKMKELGVELNSCSAVCLARACGNLDAAREGQAIHGFSIKKNFLGSSVYLQTAVLDMYGKSGFIDFAQRLFDEMPCKDVVSWSAMVTGLAKSGRAHESLLLFRDMIQEHNAANEVTLASVLMACSHLGAMQQGKSVHGYVIRHAIALDVVSYTALLDMYAKCGSAGLAYKVFGVMPEKNVFSWSAMIGGFGMHGMCSSALSLFDDMRSEGIVPNAVTFVAVLSACSHSGRVEEGRCYFESMSKEYKISPTSEHYSCMVDLFGRAGLIEEAESLIERMPFEASASVLGALLSAARVHRRFEVAERVANKLLCVEPDQSGSPVLLSNIYASAEMWDMVNKTRKRMNERGLRKGFGFSTIEVDKRIYLFHATDGFGSQEARIEELWRVLRS